MDEDLPARRARAPLEARAGSAGGLLGHSRPSREVVPGTVPPRLPSNRGPSPRLAREAYRDLAGEYDFRSRAGMPYRRLIVASLGLKGGEAVLDVGCGTGLGFAAIEEKIGGGGRLMGLDGCPEMLARARARVKCEDWRNVTLIESSAEQAEMPEQADAVLFSATHDILRSPSALQNVLRQVRAGAPVVAGGPKWAPWWAPWAPWLNTWTWEVNRPYVTTWEGFSRPWSLLERFIPDLDVEAMFFGAGYIAAGTLPRG